MSYFYPNESRDAMQSRTHEKGNGWTLEKT